MTDNQDAVLAEALLAVREAQPGNLHFGSPTFSDAPVGVAAAILAAMPGYTLVRKDTLAELRAALERIHEWHGPLSDVGPVSMDGVCICGQALANSEPRNDR